MEKMTRYMRLVPKEKMMQSAVFRSEGMAVRKFG
jgi:hypothetical protein